MAWENKEAEHADKSMWRMLEKQEHQDLEQREAHDKRQITANLVLHILIGSVSKTRVRQ